MEYQNLKQKKIERKYNEKIGCSSNSCIFGHVGYGTNSGCTCLRMLDTKTRIEIERRIKRLKLFEAIVADVMEARKTKYIGATGGGEPARYYDTELVEEAIAGFGSKGIKVLKKQNSEDES